MSSLPARRSLAGPGYTLSVFDANILEERIMRLLDKRPRPSAGKAKMSLATGFLLLAATCAAAFAFSLTVAVSTKAAVDESTVRANFSGRWELDKTRSDLPSPSPDGFVQVIELDDPHLRITTTSKDWTAAEARAGRLVLKPIAITLFALTIPEFSVNTDNRETIQKYGPGQLRSKTRWEGDNLVTDWTLERDGQAVVIGTWVRSLAAAGQIRTVEVKARDPQRGVEGKATLVFVKRSPGADLESFLGTWVGKYEGANYVIATLRTEEGKLAGTVSLGNFGVDRDGQVNNVNDQPEPAHAQPVVNARLDGDTLRVTTKALGGKDNVFQMRAGGGNELKIKWSPPSLPADAPVPGWWELTRESENSDLIKPGGPTSGVVGGVVGVVKGGV